MLHRALYGSLERFLGLLLEQHGAALPPWLAPEQVAVVPVDAERPQQLARATAVVAQLRAAGLRARLDDQRETLARRVAIAHHDGVPFVAVLGDREVEAGTLAIRGREEQWASAAASAVAELVRRCEAGATAAR
jgi:threonyl-tRNA synthetase